MRRLGSSSPQPWKPGQQAPSCGNAVPLAVHPPGARQAPWQSHTRTQHTRRELLPQLRNCDNTRSSLKNTTSTEE